MPFPRSQALQTTTAGLENRAQDDGNILMHARELKQPLCEGRGCAVKRALGREGDRAQRATNADNRESKSGINGSIRNAVTAWAAVPGLLESIRRGIS